MKIGAVLYGHAEAVTRRSTERGHHAEIDRRPDRTERVDFGARASDRPLESDGFSGTHRTRTSAEVFLAEPPSPEHDSAAPKLWQAALAVLLDSLPDAALLMTKRGHVELANSVALRMLEDPRSKSALLALRAAVVSGKNSDSFVVTDLNSRGCPGFVLAVSAQNGSRIDAAVARAEASWKVRGRRALVLERLARGESNKQIANALGCAEVTVERHVSELFRRSGTRSRTELLRALFDS